jgi:hypothetical protein
MSSDPAFGRGALTRCGGHPLTAARSPAASAPLFWQRWLPFPDELFGSPMVPTPPALRLLKALASILLLVLVLPATGLAQQLELRGLTLLSLIGDQISAVIRQPPTDTRLDRNRREVMPMPPAAFDDYALDLLRFQAAEKVAGLKIDLLSANDATLYEAQESWLTSDDVRLVAIRRAISQRMAATGCSHLLMLTKHAAESRVRLADRSMGDGRLTGLGFYLDYSTRVTRSDTQETGTGFIGPFAYIRLSLVDGATFKVVRSEHATASAGFSAARSDTGVDPWQALSPQRKLDVLRSLLRTELTRLLPVLLP